METTENNKLIAEFMGMNYGDPNDNSVMTQMTPQGNEVVPIDSMKYHNSWDWLMPVVEQCLEKHNNLIDGRDVIDTLYSLIAQALFVVSLKETYEAVVEFIKGYNKQK